MGWVVGVVLGRLIGVLKEGVEGRSALKKTRFSPEKNRLIPSAVKREVALRDHFQCRLVGKYGR